MALALEVLPPPSKSCLTRTLLSILWGSRGEGWTSILTSEGMMDYHQRAPPHFVSIHCHSSWRTGLPLNQRHRPLVLAPGPPSTSSPTGPHLLLRRTYCLRPGWTAFPVTLTMHRT
ncbi:hypothetical protein LX32DRAFT_340630 [Colletotrichum zoysiae]|uniref:Uncharacterized protein n=1 Tax=Colletotrichum zoysiae TaxID=1216348 RepID=A0AAD9HTJ1_9PEZI|nr:hypothetical protein LX32DRAFT_340630 [Colletotrichum zoysiae]